MRVPIKGVSSKALKKVVDKALDDAGYTACEVNGTLDTLVIPDIYMSEVDEIALILAETGDFEIDIIL